MTLAALRRDLRAVADPAHAEVAQRYFKEPQSFLGIRVPALRKVVRQHVDLGLPDTEKLLASSWHEERLAALLILVHHYRREPDAVYALYLRNTARIDNWDLVDASAPHIVGAHLFTRDRSVLYTLAQSSSVWERRIAIIATQYFIRHGELRVSSLRALGISPKPPTTSERPLTTSESPLGTSKGIPGIEKRCFKHLRDRTQHVPEVLQACPGSHSACPGSPSSTSRIALSMSRITFKHLPDRTHYVNLATHYLPDRTQLPPMECGRGCDLPETTHR